MQPDEPRYPVRSLLTAVAFLVVTALAVANAPVTPDVLTGNADLSLKYGMLREHVDRDGPSDVILVGSSVVYRGLVANALSQKLTEGWRLDRRVRVFNFGFGGHTSRVVSRLARISKNDEPRALQRSRSPKKFMENP